LLRRLAEIEGEVLERWCLLCLGRRLVIEEKEIVVIVWWLLLLLLLI